MVSARTRRPLVASQGPNRGRNKMGAQNPRIASVRTQADLLGRHLLQPITAFHRALPGVLTADGRLAILTPQLRECLTGFPRGLIIAGVPVSQRVARYVQDSSGSYIEPGISPKPPLVSSSGSAYWPTKTGKCATTGMAETSTGCSCSGSPVSRRGTCSR